MCDRICGRTDASSRRVTVIGRVKVNPPRLTSQSVGSAGSMDDIQVAEKGRDVGEYRRGEGGIGIQYAGNSPRVGDVCD